MTTSTERTVAPERTVTPERTASAGRAVLSEQAIPCGRTVLPEQAIAPKRAVPPARAVLPQRATPSTRTVLSEQAAWPERASLPAAATLPEQAVLSDQAVLSERWIDILLAPDRERLTVAEVCRRHGISRKTFYVYLARYRSEGPAGLAPRSRRPRNSPARTAGEIEALVVRIRDERPRWGARRIHNELVRRGVAGVPAVSTVHAILRRTGRLAGA
ncbi:helix-turn-helix domain-containing protein [Streptomyces sp. NPDC000134]|uniref:helix-turn-helix domain-containing protein n=1 Tax=Streptomyces sp. NPDC000134 TaxID=3364536 RepID=UPI0036CFB50D